MQHAIGEMHVETHVNPTPARRRQALPTGQQGSSDLMEGLRWPSGQTAKLTAADTNP